MLAEIDSSSSDSEESSEESSSKESSSQNTKRDNGNFPTIHEGLDLKAKNKDLDAFDSDQKTPNHKDPGTSPQAESGTQG